MKVSRSGMSSLAKKFALGIDIGGTKLRVGLVSEELELVGFCLSLKNIGYLTPKAWLIWLQIVFLSWLIGIGRIELIGTGVGYPGPINFLMVLLLSYCKLT